MNERIIESEECLKEGSGYLADRFPEFSYAIDMIGSLNLRRQPDGFSQLLSAIVSQQLSVAAANSSEAMRSAVAFSRAPRAER